MDVVLLSENSLKLKIKKTSVIINPNTKTPKNDADVVISTDEDADPTRVNDYRLLISASGEYEVSGLKISAIKEQSGLVFVFSSDGKQIVWSTSSVLSKIPPDRVRECEIAIINANSEIPENVITAMEPRAIVFYGGMSKSAVQSLGKESTSSSKISITEDKLPEETVLYQLS
ncbi:MAG: hypothetical protein A2798_03060 [Candidatus Levybacteria bacterium RIFCSPHIGHO2_01_FULL_37_17]|nr:MAG: hypothetical protein A2798_03060 [Candidatus Levybacteria bacterium RIFCSPHIGHO2_01_FULL_37_17]OGH36834.1 MAG: hypothetical protein A2959_01050 [Candidatus Levybacteria bacterium RIFCSPLOWO2_01_FULL_38_23]